VRDRIQRARRPADDEVLAAPVRPGRDEGRHGRHRHADDGQHRTGRHGAALRPDPLVQRHRVAAHQRGLQPA
jgi:hypothetical protein